MIEIYMEVGPAYGRDYKSQKAVKADWAAGKDFQVLDVGRDMGRMINKQDADGVPGLRVLVRYQGMTKVVQVK
jgi:hypothetical protein